MNNPDLYFLAAAAVVVVLFVLIAVWRAHRKKNRRPDWPDDIEYR